MGKMSALGIGFTGLDIVKYKENEKIMTGGTCGNVMGALASLNWKTDIIKSHYNDYWNDVANLLWKSIDVNIIDCGVANCSLPRIVEVLNEIKNYHYTTCPQCGVKLNDFAIPSRHKLKSMEIDFSKYDLLFYDRIADGTKYLLDLFFKNNKWTFYEPNSARNYDTWIKNILSCDIVKFSGDRIHKTYYNKLIGNLNNQKHNTKIVLVTHSRQGFSYSITNGEKMSELKSVDVNGYNNVVDSSGAGDWFSAGFADKLLQKYNTPTKEIDEELVIEALSFGHSLAEDACMYVGALGKLFSKKNVGLSGKTFSCDFCKSSMILA